MKGLLIIGLVIACMTSGAVVRKLKYPSWPEDFSFSEHGKDPDRCVQIVEPLQPLKETWRDNYFCWSGDDKKTNLDIGFKWSHNPPKPSRMKCTMITEPSDYKWKNNYLCVPNTAPYDFEWSYKGQIRGKSCIAWREPSDFGDAWHDNFLCAKQTNPNLPLPNFPADFKWSNGYTAEGYDCMKIGDFSRDHFLCWKHGTKDPGFKFDMYGKDNSMKCIQTYEGPIIKRIIKRFNIWSDNFFCVPLNSPYNFYWTYKGETEGKTCLAWRQGSAAWKDNYLCADPDATLPDPVFPDDFKWSNDNIPEGYDCIKIHDKSHSTVWWNSFLCWRHGTKDPGMEWSSAWDSSIIRSKKCIEMLGPSERQTDNFLCVPKESELDLEWSYNKTSYEPCIQLKVRSETSGWLCPQTCQLTNIEVLEGADVDAERFDGTEILDIVSGGTCVGEGLGTLNVESSKTVEESVGVELSNAKEINWSLTSSVELESKLFGNGIALGASVGVGGSKTLEASTSRSFNSEISKGISYTTTYRPGGVIVVKTVDRYKISASSLPVKMHFQCVNGRKFVKRSTIEMKADTFQHVHFEEMSNRFNPDTCLKNSGVIECLDKVKKTWLKRRGLDKISKLRTDFESCFAGNIGKFIPVLLIMSFQTFVIY